MAAANKYVDAKVIEPSRFKGEHKNPGDRLTLTQEDFNYHRANGKVEAPDVADKILRERTPAQPSKK